MMAKSQWGTSRTPCDSPTKPATHHWQFSFGVLLLQFQWDPIWFSILSLNCVASFLHLLPRKLQNLWSLSFQHQRAACRLWSHRNRKWAWYSSTCSTTKSLHKAMINFRQKTREKHGETWRIRGCCVSAMPLPAETQRSCMRSQAQRWHHLVHLRNKFLQSRSMVTTNTLLTMFSVKIQLTYDRMSELHIFGYWSHMFLLWWYMHIFWWTYLVGWFVYNWYDVLSQKKSRHSFTTINHGSLQSSAMLTRYITRYQHAERSLVTPKLGEAAKVLEHMDPGRHITPWQWPSS